ncbi:hypothetical protein [Sellimonas intestinalis]|nr:hypothetical protein [Sellimonas intestinalis]
MEIKVVVHPQRVREGESRMERSQPNGPQRAQSKADIPAQYSAT